MPPLLNPFNQLYVAETIPSADFVRLFSPYLINDAMALYQPGNVILRGVQGSGKTMLLSLLKPEIRLAYAQAQTSFPVPGASARFIGAGINLTRSGAIDFGQRPIEPDPQEDAVRAPLYFADFLNYWILRDICCSIDKYTRGEGHKIGKELGIVPAQLDAFADKLAREGCWSGYLHAVRNYADLKDSLNRRLAAYRDYLNYNKNEDALPVEIQRTKTPIGEPISRAVASLQDASVVPDTVEFYVRIDQYEELAQLEDAASQQQNYVNYRQIVNKLLSTRDPRVSYRIGGRRYAWRDNLTIYGTSSALEEERNYKLVDLDTILRRRENSRAWSFPGFAEDVLRRRLSLAGLQPPKPDNNWVGQIFGTGLSAEGVAAAYARPPYSDIIVSEPGWPNEVIGALTSLAESDPLAAKLGEAWVRQQMDRKAPSLPTMKYRPWEARSKQYWRKERISQALMQIAAGRRQRMMWSGKDDVLALSGGNILVFLSLCQHTWAAWLRSIRDETEIRGQEGLRVIPAPIQDEGIQLASGYWQKKMSELPGGSARQRFVDVLGAEFRERLLKDTRMSYPGHNGFSVERDKLDTLPALAKFLRDAVDYGDLFDSPHTPKTKGRRKRTKWYLNPILSPYYQIPVGHTKEPLYASIEELVEWVQRTKALEVKCPAKRRGKAPVQPAGTLFPDEETGA